MLESSTMVPESPLVRTETGLVPERDGWLVVNAHVGAGEGPPVVVAMGARVQSLGPGWGGYTVDAAALRHGAGVEHDTIEPDQAYSGLPRREPTRYRPGWRGD